MRTLFYHFLERARRVDLHSVEVIEAIDFRRVLGELLTESIGEIVRWVCRLYRVILLLGGYETIELGGLR